MLSLSVIVLYMHIDLFQEFVSDWRLEPVVLICLNKVYVQLAIA